MWLGALCELEYLEVYGRTSMGVPVGELQSIGLELRKY